MWLQAFLNAMQLMTRIPVHAALHPEPAQQDKAAGHALLFYPVMGLLIGALLVSLLWLMEQVSENDAHLLSAMFLLLLWVVVTGVLHLDGLADSADAWLGGFGDRERTLAIMKDPCVGPAGVAAIIVILLIKFAALSEISLASWPALLVIPVLARMQVMALFLTTTYVRPGGMGAAAAANLPRKPAWVWLLVLMAGIVLFVEQGGWLLVGALTTLTVLRQIMRQRIGGTTGDTAGALIEISEAVLLCLAVIVP